MRFFLWVSVCVCVLVFVVFSSFLYSDSCGWKILINVVMLCYDEYSCHTLVRTRVRLHVHVWFLDVLCVERIWPSQARTHKNAINTTLVFFFVSFFRFKIHIKHTRANTHTYTHCVISFIAVDLVVYISNRSFFLFQYVACAHTLNGEVATKQLQKTNKQI